MPGLGWPKVFWGSAGVRQKSGFPLGGGAVFISRFYAENPDYL
jgi:hypothetical protein